MRQKLPSLLLALSALFKGPSVMTAQRPNKPAQLKKVTVADGVELHYVERGKGVPVVFVHGTIAEYGVWDRYLGPFADSYHALAYSRRYNSPNANPAKPKYSAMVDAEDLAALIKKLELGKSHIVGHSYGTYTALWLAVQHPQLVRSRPWPSPRPL
jgi:pimeloyl-ACP methyl ester carboxylesterase